MAWDSANVLDAFCGACDVLEMGMLANQVRNNLHPENVITYELRGIASSFESGCEEALVHGTGSVDLSHVRELQGTTLDTLPARLSACHKRHPGITFHHFPVAVEDLAKKAITREGLRNLCDAGLRSLRLDFDPLHFPLVARTSVAALLQSAASCELLVAAALTIGKGESCGQRVEMLKAMHLLQQETEGIQAVLVRVHHASEAAARREEEATAVDYLQTLAITRIYLDTVPHMQADWSVMGPKVLELALRFGADDAGAVPWSQAGNPEPSHHGGESELRRIIRDAGFRPVERDPLFRQSLLR